MTAAGRPSMILFRTNCPRPPASVVRHGRQTTLRIASTHGRAGWAERVLTGVARFLRRLIDAAEQLTVEATWAIILSAAFVKWLRGKVLRPVMHDDQVLLQLPS